MQEWTEQSQLIRERLEAPGGGCKMKEETGEKAKKKKRERKIGGKV